MIPLRFQFLLLLNLANALAMAQSTQEKDTMSLAGAVRKTSLHGNIRNVFLYTDNAPGLSDYHAYAAGGKITIETGGFHGMKLTAGAYFTFPRISSDLASPDPASGSMNRYESSLFDVTDPAARKGSLLPGILNLSYEWKRNRIILGRQLLNTPFINAQDNRMQPTMVEGLYADLEKDKWKMEFGLISGFAPRGTMQWYTVAGSIGRYPQGVNRDGSKGNYQGNISSKGIGLLGLHWRPDEKYHFQVWEQYADDLFNTFYFQGDLSFPGTNNSHWLIAAQYIRQDIVGEGGNDGSAKTYFGKGNLVNVLGGRMGWENKRIRLLLNYSRITGSGRFLMPREWGTEPLFTFLNRERNEGAGDVQAVSATARYEIPALHLTLDAGFGKYHMPDVKQFALNKYGLPSYHHFKAGIEYICSGCLNNLKIAALFVYKWNDGNTWNDLKYVANKVDMAHFAFSLNLPFGSK